MLLSHHDLLHLEKARFYELNTDVNGRIGRHLEDHLQRGYLLRAAQERDMYREEGLQDIYAWADQHQKIGRREADRLLSVSNLPAEMIAGLPANIKKLAILGGAQEPLRPALREALLTNPGIPESLLTTAANAGKAKLDLNCGEEEARAHTLQMALGQIKPPVGKRSRKGKPRKRPDDLGRQAIEGIGGVKALVGNLRELKKAGKGLDATLREQLLGQVPALIHELAELLDCEPLDLAADRRDRDRGPGPGPRGPNDTKASDSSTLHDRPAAGPVPGSAEGPERPGPASLCHAATTILSPEEQARLEERLYEILRGDPIDAAAPFLASLRDRLSGGTREGRDLFDRWEQGTCHPLWQTRFESAFPFFLSAGLPGFREHLHLLLTYPIPDAERAQVLEACRGFALHPPDEDEEELVPETEADEEALALLSLMRDVRLEAHELLRRWAEGEDFCCLAQRHVVLEATSMEQDGKELRRLIGG